jgi:TolB-like protein
VQELMERCLKKNPGQRFQSANDIAVALKALLESHLDDVPATKASPKRFRRLWILSVVTILIVIVLAAGVKFRNFLGAPRIQSIAVLPLVNLSGDPQQEYIADGITDELINELGQLSGLRVISHTSIMQYKKTTPPLSKIAKDLKVDAVLEGSVLLSGDRVEIRSRLVDTRTEKRLWGKPY